MKRIKSISTPLKKSLYLLLLLSFCGLAKSQKYYHNWLISYDFLLSFNGNTPVRSVPNYTNISNLVQWQSINSCISDANGNFFSTRVWNGFRDPNNLNAFIPNGLGSNSATGITDIATELYIKQPGNNPYYYHFKRNNFTNLSYSIIDASSAPSTGSVIAKDVIIFSDPSMSNYTGEIAGISATRHCNGQDFWLVLNAPHSALLSGFYAFALTAAGLNTVAVASPSIINQSGIGMGDTYFEFSPNGKKLVACTRSNDLHICNFNASTGVVSLQQHIVRPTSASVILPPSQNTIDNQGPICFSPDGSKLYQIVHSNRSQRVFQMDLCAPTASAIAASRTLVCNTGAIKADIQLAPDGKIYLTRNSDPTNPNAELYLSVINNPNAYGSACNFVEQGFFTGTTNYNGYLPTIVESYYNYTPHSLGLLGNISAGLVSCTTCTFLAPPNPTFNCSALNYSLTSKVWDFGDPSSGSANTSTLSNPSHTYPSNGNYIAKLIYNYECGSDTLIYPLTITNVFTVNPLSTAATCTSLGSATANVGGGLGPYTYTWSPVVASSSLVQNLSPNVYTVSINDNNTGCSKTTSIQVNANYQFTGTLSTNDILCNGIPTGSASVQVTGGTGNYNYSWSLPITQTTSTINNLAAGNYSVSVIDLSGPCSYTTVFTILQPPSLTASINASTLTACVGNSIILQPLVSGGLVPYTYNWSNGVVTPSNLISPASSGNYTSALTITDANNCINTQTIQLGFINGPLLSVINPTICSGYNATLTVNGALTATWYPNNSVGNNLEVNPNVNTQYTVVGFAFGCNATSSVLATVYVVPPPNLTVSLSSATACAQAFNGSPNTITLTSSGASNYTLITPSEFNNFNPAGPQSPISLMPPFLNTGPATATLLGTNGVCTVSTTAVFSIIPNPTVSVNNPTPVICAGQSYTYTSAGAGSYTWSSAIPGSTTYTSGQVTVVSPTVNSVFSIVGGSLGCYSPIKTTTLTVNPLPTVNIVPGNLAICKGDKQKLIVKTNGTSINWQPITWLSNNATDTVETSPAMQQTYTVTSSLNSCTSSAMVTVSLLTLPVAFISNQSPSICLGNSIKLQGSGGVNYKWLLPNSINENDIAKPSLIINAKNHSYSGTYTLVAIDQNNCKGYSTTKVHLYDLPNGYFRESASNRCVPFLNEFEFVEISNQQTIKEYSWQLQNSYYSTKYFSHLFKSPGVYALSGTIKDNHNCINTLTTTIEAYSKPIANYNFLPENPIESIDEVLFTNQSKNASIYQWHILGLYNQNNFESDYHYNNSNWEPRQNPINKDLFELTSTDNEPSYKFDYTGVYPVVLIAESKQGCADTIIKIINILSDFAVYVPNSFTPNNDDKNEWFLPVIRGVKQLSFSVFNRWGKKLFETTSLNEGWDGQFNEEPCPEGVYVWKLQVSSTTGMHKEFAGNVNLFR